MSSIPSGFDEHESSKHEHRFAEHEHEAIDLAETER